MFLDDRITDGETESGAGRLRREIRVEDFCPQFLPNTGAAIANRHLDVTARRQGRVRVFLEDNVPCPNADRAALRHRLPGVKHQRVDDLLDLPRIDFHSPEINRDVEVGPQV